MKFDELSNIVLGAAIDVHRALGPGLLETVYEQVLAARLERMGHHVQRQRAIDIVFEDLRFEAAFRADLIVDHKLLLELKSIEALGRVHAKQVTTYIRLADLKVGLLINFGGATLEGQVRRFVNNY
jgi:GxxExxY protein